MEVVKSFDTETLDKMEDEAFIPKIRDVEHGNKAEVIQRLTNSKESTSKPAALYSHEDLAKKLQEEMEKNRKASSGSKSSEGSGRRMREIACPTCTVHLQVQVPSSGSETIECGACQHPFLENTSSMIQGQSKPDFETSHRLCSVCRKSFVSTESSHQNQWNPNKLIDPKPPRLLTMLRSRPPKAKSSQELEQEELEKIPKFKARPLNKRIFKSKGDMGLFSQPKRQVTRPQEFHFATDERIPQAKSVADLFDKLSLNLESHHDHKLPRITMPNPFHLNTEERGAEKERRLAVEVMQKQLEEERARVPKASPYPYTTDYPVIPPKAEPKQCTKPEPFQLKSYVRHDVEIQREMEERRRLEKEEAQMRIFKARPILKEDPLPVPKKERKPLTQIDEFALHIDQRAVDRAEFDKKIKERENMYKRYLEDAETAKIMEEEKALKVLRSTLVPYARPMPIFDNPFLPQKSSKGTTIRKSPKLRVLQRKQRRSSTAASQMR